MYIYIYICIYIYIYMCIYVCACAYARVQYVYTWASISAWVSVRISGDKSIQCGRKGDGLKVWAMWRAYGDKELERQVDANFDNAR